MRKASWPMATVNTDEWGGSNGLTATGRRHATVCHADWEWDRDDDGDGVREVHDNTPEGLWIISTLSWVRRAMAGDPAAATHGNAQALPTTKNISSVKRTGCAASARVAEKLASR